MSPVVKQVRELPGEPEDQGERRIEIILVRALPQAEKPDSGLPVRAVAGRSSLTIDSIDGSRLTARILDDVPAQGDRIVLGGRPRGASAAVVTVSDRSSRGEREDHSWPALRATLWLEGYDIGPSSYRLVPDEVDRIAAALRELVEGGARLVLTTGGTGAAPRDVTPEATRLVVGKELPGFGEAMRMRSFEKNPLAIGSRALAGIAGATLIVNLPGNPRGALECFDIVRPCLAHTLGLIAAEVRDCGEAAGAAAAARGGDGPS